MFTYRLHLEDGSDAGTATYAQMIRPGEEILVGNGRRFRVVDVVPFEKEDESPFVGLLRVEAEGNWQRSGERVPRLARWRGWAPSTSKEVSSTPALCRIHDGRRR